MKPGVTSFVFRYLLLDPCRPAALEEMLEKVRDLKLSRLQVCENAAPLKVTNERWQDFVRKAQDFGIEISLGCKTLDPVTLEAYLARASKIPSKTLRVVLEAETGPPTQEGIDDFLTEAVKLAEKYGMRLAIENHFDISTKALVASVRSLPAEIVGFCLDVANSLRRFEPVDFVFESLGSRAYCYHLKDFKVKGSDVGFSVVGTPLGEGDLDLHWALKTILSIDSEPEVYLETWVPSTGALEKDIEHEWEWLSQSIKTFADHVRRLRECNRLRLRSR